jgi:hypothetical protein
MTMYRNRCADLQCAPDMPTKTERKIKGLLGLLASVLIIIIFLFVIGPWGEKLPGFQPLAEFIDERGIEANMYFYTEVEEFSEADINMNNTMQFPPRDFSQQDLGK